MFKSLYHRLVIWKTILLSPAIKIFLAVCGIIRFLEWCLGKIPANLQEKLGTVVIPHLSWQTWTIIVLVGLIFFIMESSYRLISPKIFKIEAIYDNNHHDCRCPFGKNVLYRVGLLNYGNVDVEGVKVKLRVLQPEDPFHGFPVGEQLLKPKDDRTPFPLANQGLRVNPGNILRVFVDVAYLKKDGTTQLCHVLDDIPCILRSPITQYRFSLSIEGHNVLPVLQYFHIDPVNGIQFEK